MRMISQMLLCNACKSHIPRLCTPDKRALDFKCPNCGTMGTVGKITESPAREVGSETKRQRDRVQGIIRDNMREQVDGLGHTLDLSKGINKGEALVRATTHQATVESEARQFKQQMQETPTPVGSNGWDRTFAQHGFPNTHGLLANARAQYMGDSDPRSVTGLGKLHGALNTLSGKR